MPGIHFSFERCAWDVKPLKLVQQRSIDSFAMAHRRHLVGIFLEVFPFMLSRSKSSGNRDNGN